MQMAASVERLLTARNFLTMVRWRHTFPVYSEGRVSRFSLFFAHTWTASIETLPIFQNCPRSSQTIGNIYDFEFSLVRKIWDGRQIVKFLIVRDFPDIRKPGLSADKVILDKSKRGHTIVNVTGEQIITNGMNNWTKEIKKEEIKFE